MSDETSTIERLGGPALDAETIALLDAALDAGVRAAFDLMVGRLDVSVWEAKLLWPGVSYAANKSAAMKLAELAK